MHKSFNFSASEISIVLTLKVLVGPLFGFVMGRVTIFWLINIYNDALAEITITLASTYITFYVCKYYFNGLSLLQHLTFL